MHRSQYECATSARLPHGTERRTGKTHIVAAVRASRERVAEVHVRVLDGGASRQDGPAGDDDEDEDADLEDAQALKRRNENENQRQIMGALGGRRSCRPRTFMTQTPSFGVKPWSSVTNAITL